MSVRGIAVTVCLRHLGTNEGADSEKCADEFEGRYTRGACSAGQLHGERRQTTWVENEVAGPELNSSEGRNEPEGKRSEFHSFASRICNVATELSIDLLSFKAHLGVLSFLSTG